MNYQIIFFTVIILIALISLKGKFKVKNIISSLPTSKGGWPERPLFAITHVTVHHSATGTNQTSLDFANYHVFTRKWKGIAYHYVIDFDGTINKTNKHSANSWHNGTNNSESIGICLVGDFTRSEPSKDQLKSLMWLLKKLSNDKDMNIAYCVGHRELGRPTSCPGNLDMNKIRNDSGLKYGSSVALKNRAKAKNVVFDLDGGDH